MYDRTVAVPRLVATYGVGVAVPHPVLDRAKSALAGHYRGQPGAELATIGLCLYRDGRDSVAWHGDTVGRGATGDTLVAVVSLGWARRLHLRPARGGGTSHAFSLGGGDLLVMGGTCQRTWQHAVPKTARPVGPPASVCSSVRSACADRARRRMVHRPRVRARAARCLPARRSV